jgi:hypothetical protein
MKSICYLNDTWTVYAAASQFTTGAKYDATGSVTYQVYKQAVGTPILTGTLALLDDTNRTGLYAADIALTAANGFEVNKCYLVHVEATVDSVNAHVNCDELVLRPEQLTLAQIALAVWSQLEGVFAPSPNAASFGSVLATLFRFFRNRTATPADQVIVYADDNATPLMASTFTEAINGGEKGRFQ